jgi:hypothetical protein
VKAESVEVLAPPPEEAALVAASRTAFTWLRIKLKALERHAL